MTSSIEGHDGAATSMAVNSAGRRAARWSEIRSETVDVHGTKVHYLVADQTRRSEVPVHLLVPNPANGASNWPGADPASTSTSSSG
jgi:hypothetical protein